MSSDSPIPHPARKRVLLCVGTALLAGVLAEGVARRILPDSPDPIEMIRNPYRFRNFPEYIRAAVEVPDYAERGIVLLGNSQAYGGEVPDIRTYSTWLERDLRREQVGGRDDWQVFNWSTDGMTTIEHTILAAYLQQHPPAMVLCVTGFADYRSEQAEAGFSYCRSDVPRLATRVDVARRIPGSYWKRHFKVEDVLSAWVRARFDLPRIADYLWSAADQQHPGLQPLCYAPAINYHPWELHTEPRSRSMEIGTTADDRVELTYDAASLAMFTTYLETLAEIPAPVLVVGQPSGLGGQDRNHQALADYQNDLESLVSREAPEVMNLTRALDPGHFHDGVHFNRRGHRAFADLLYPLVSTRLENADP